MIEINLDSDLDLKINALDKDIHSRNSIIYVPGFGTMGKKRKSIINKLINHDVNVISFIYKSHQGNVLSNLERDTEDLAKVIERLNNLDISDEQIAFFSICYGAHITAKNLSQGKKHKYAIMLEPYLGKNSLTLSGKLIYSLLASASNLGINKIPIGRRYEGQNASLDLNSAIQTSYSSTEPIKSTPLYVVSTNTHKLIDCDYVQDWVKQSGGVYQYIEAKSKFNLMEKVNSAVKSFLTENK